MPLYHFCNCIVYVQGTSFVLVSNLNEYSTLKFIYFSRNLATDLDLVIECGYTNY